MGRKRKANVPVSGERKRRTRSHTIADLSVNFVERLALKCGFVIQRENPDYSLDLRVSTFDTHGNVEAEQVWLQLKATDAIEDYRLGREDCFSYSIVAKDYFYWVDEVIMPVFLVLYDAQREEAYWVDIKRFEQSQPASRSSKTIQVHLPCFHVMGTQAMYWLRQRKQLLLEQFKDQS